jgi:hypothetical protein
MSNQRRDLPVTGTSWRPGFLPLFVLGRNNVSPRLVVSPQGLEFGVVRTTKLDWNGITKVDVRRGIGSTYAVISHGGWDYIAHFRELDGLRTLVNQLREHGVALTPAAETIVSEHAQ